VQITVFGSGYVGLVTGTCFADEGNQVLCVDIDPAKVERLKNGDIPIFEPGLAELVERNMEAGRLEFTTDAAQGVAHGEVIFIAVGTPEKEDGSADLQYVFAVARTIGELIEDYRIVVDKSTVPVGTGAKVRSIIAEVLAARGSQAGFDVVSNPEFLKEGDAIQDFVKPDRIVLGSDSEHALQVMRDLYKPFLRSRDRVLAMDLQSAELTKYASNVMLATKVSLMNELSNLADAVGADIELVRQGIGADRRIGYHFIYPGCGFGGSCFPKDVAALARTADEVGCETPILDGVLKVNDFQKRVLPTKLKKHFGDLAGKKIALWGLAFKPNTDDMREAPSRVLMEYLWEQGAVVQAHDPEAMREARKIYGERPDLVLCKDPMAALSDADALVVVTEWHLFRNPDFGKLKERLREPVIFDGRNIYDPRELAEKGFAYYGIGRSSN